MKGSILLGKMIRLWKSSICLCFLTTLYVVSGNAKKCIDGDLRGNITLEPRFNLERQEKPKNYHYCQGRSEYQHGVILIKFEFENNILFSEGIETITLTKTTKALSFVSLRGDVRVNYGIKVGGNTMQILKGDDYHMRVGRYLGGFHTAKEEYKSFTGKISNYLFSLDMKLCLSI